MKKETHEFNRGVIAFIGSARIAKGVMDFGAERFSFTSLQETLDFDIREEAMKSKASNSTIAKRIGKDRSTIWRNR